ncbi:5'-nucleotidase C-terminal domain-containing protein [Clostridium sp.]|uniref:5'-nucleotidase C-terminal domain-containing protein n=1 Tax=Clostridium sp. TaxID=1506 RepID=UPI001A5546BD|nr:5'-nucleotidase C-terminal domain-containing protein [Clostridium sp.]MBK5236864.1 5'-nucleotidase C-terminal domain-containing protein [Clostridium sp.]
MFNNFKGKKLTAWLLTLMMVLTFFGPANVLAAESSETSIQILATSDMHGRFLPYDYAVNAPDTSGSMAQLQTIIKELRKANPNTILVDNGDTIQDNSSSLFNNDAIHPMVLGMNEMGYDTWSFGNHEFNYGIPVLQSISSKFTGTVLCGNVFDKDGKSLGESYKIIEKDGVKIAIIGMVSPHITKWDGPNLIGYTVTNPVEETRKVVDEIKGKVDVMIVTLHAGENAEYGNGDSARELAKACPELTAIVAGHAHATITEVKEGNVIITEPNKGASQLAKIDINLTKNADGKYSIVDAKSDIVYASPKGEKPVVADAGLSAKLQPYSDTAIADANVVIGELKGGDLNPASEIKGIPTAQVKDTAMIDLINKVQMFYTGADIASAASFSTTANIKEGKIIKAGTASIYKYDNTLMTLKITGAQLKKYMEWSATYYNTFKPGDLTVSFNENIRDYNYDMFSGVKYDVDVSKEPGKRIVNLTKIDGSQIKDTDVLTLAVNNYRASTTLLNEESGLFKGEGVQVVFDSFKSMGDNGRIRDLIRKYIVEEKNGVITPELDNNWKIIGNEMDATKAAFAAKLINSGKLELPKSSDGRTSNVKSVTYEDTLAANGVNILTFNDFHGAVEESGKNSGIAKFAGEINKVKITNPNTIVVSAGDSFQGSAMSNLTYGEPVNEMMKSVGVVASAVGNHEFDWGTDKIAKWAEEGGYKFVASNIYDKNTGKPVTWAEPYIIVEKGGVKIGLVGIATPETAYKTSPVNVKDLEFKDPVASAKEWAKVAKDNGADVVIALTHLGSFQDKDGRITGEATQLCGVLNIDAVISAHSHQTVSGSVNGIPVVQAYYSGRTLGKLTIKIDESGKLAGIVPSVDNLYNRPTTLVEDPAVKAIADKYTKELQPILSEVLGTTDIELPHDKTVPGTSLLGQWTTDVMRKVAGTQIGITNGGGLRVPLAAGNITMGNMYEVMPFDNTLVTMELKGSDLKKVIENGIGNEEIGWVQIGGVKVYYDEKADFGKRISAMVLEDGTTVEMDKTYTVVTNDFMFTGGDKFDFAGAINSVDTMIPIRDALVSELKAVKAISVKDKNNLVAGVAPVVTQPVVTPPVVTPPALPIKEKYVVITAKSGLNFRVAGSVASKKLGVFKYNTTVKVVSETSLWYKVNYNGAVGYIYRAYTKIAPVVTMGSKYVTTTAKSGLNFRTSESTSSNILGVLKYATVVKVLGESSLWYKVNYNGKVGYIYKTYAKITTTNVVKAA